MKWQSSEIFGGEFDEKPQMGIIYYADDFDLSIRNHAEEFVILNW